MHKCHKYARVHINVSATGHRTHNYSLSCYLQRYI